MIEDFFGFKKRTGIVAHFCTKSPYPKHYDLNISKKCPMCGKDLTDLEIKSHPKFKYGLAGILALGIIAFINGIIGAYYDDAYPTEIFFVVSILVISGMVLLAVLNNRLIKIQGKRWRKAYDQDKKEFDKRFGLDL